MNRDRCSDGLLYLVVLAFATGLFVGVLLGVCAVILVMP